MPARPVFVTGGSGVVGTAVVRRLVADGRAVRGLARSDAAADALRAAGAEPIGGDVLQPPEDLAKAMEGCDVVYHVAGVNRFCLRDPSAMHETNVRGSVNVVEAAARAGMRRVVYTSSAVTLGEEHGTVGSEDSRHRGSFLSEYERSKFAAESAVRDAAASSGVDVVYVNPSSVQGPGRASGTGQVLVAYLRGRLRFWVDTVISVVDIDDCAVGHVLAEGRGAAGQRYVLNAVSLTSADLLRIMRDMAPGVRPPRLISPAVAAVAVSGVAAVARVRGRDPIVCRESLRALAHGHRYDGSRAERELGLAYRPVEDTLARTARWLVGQGLAPPSALAAVPPGTG